MIHVFIVTHDGGSEEIRDEQDALHLYERKALEDSYVQLRDTVYEDEIAYNDGDYPIEDYVVYETRRDF